MATYPRFPQNASDNRCHLQAFRHLYALAARRRLLRAVDAAAGVDVTAPVEMRVRGDIDHRVVIARTPCLLPDPSVLVSVKVAGDRYWPVSVDDARGLSALYATRTLPVQRLAGALPYAADPTGARAGAAASLDVVRARAALEAPRGLRVKETNEAFDAAARASNASRAAASRDFYAAAGDDAAFGADPASAGFARLMCASVASETSDGNDVFSQRRERAALASFCESALRECARREAPDAAAAYVDAYAAARAVCAAAEEARDRERAESFVRSSDEEAAYVRVPPEPESATIARALALADARLAADLEITSRFDPSALEAQDENDFFENDEDDEENDARVATGPRRFAAPVMPRALAASFLETARDALDAMRFDAPNEELFAYYANGFGFGFLKDDAGDATSSRKTSPEEARRRVGRARKRAGLFGAYLRFFRFPTAFAVRRALAKFGLGAPGSGLDPEAVAVALAVGLPGTEPAAALRVARCGL
jgi:hypothetical protein